MTRIYNFEEKNPPVLNEKMLRNELKRREAKKEILILRIASVLVCLCILLFAFLIIPTSKVIAVTCVIFTTLSIIGNATITLLFYRKGMCLN